MRKATMVTLGAKKEQKNGEKCICVTVYVKRSEWADKQGYTILSPTVD